LQEERSRSSWRWRDSVQLRGLPAPEALAGRVCCLHLSCSCCCAQMHALLWAHTLRPAAACKRVSRYCIDAGGVRLGSASMKRRRPTAGTAWMMLRCRRQRGSCAAARAPRRAGQFGVARLVHVYERRSRSRSYTTVVNCRTSSDKLTRLLRSVCPRGCRFRPLARRCSLQRARQGPAPARPPGVAGSVCDRVHDGGC
jgi:hypothetical protein